MKWKNGILHDYTNKNTIFFLFFCNAIVFIVVSVFMANIHNIYDIYNIYN